MNDSDLIRLNTHGLVLAYYHTNYSIYKSPCHFKENSLNMHVIMCMNKSTVQLNQIIRLKAKCNQDHTH